MQNSQLVSESKPDSIQLIEDYDRACREYHMAFSDTAKTAAATQRNILAGLVLSDSEIDINTRVKVATAQGKALGNNKPLRRLRRLAA